MTDWSPEIIGALGDEKSLVRKAAALAVGQLKITAAADHLQPLLDAEAAANARGARSMPRRSASPPFFALHRLGKHHILPPA